MTDAQMAAASSESSRTRRQARKCPRKKKCRGETKQAEGQRSRWFLDEVKLSWSACITVPVSGLADNLSTSCFREWITPLEDPVSKLVENGVTTVDGYYLY